MRAAPQRSTVAAIGILFLTVGCDSKRGAEVAAPPRINGDVVEFSVNAPQLKAFQVTQATSVETPSLTFTGRLVWNEDATSRIVPPVAGRIEKLVPVGARVSRGGVLAQLSSPDFGQSQADEARARADLAAADRSRERIARLVQRGALPRKDLEAAETELARARVEAQRTRSRLERWGGNSGSGADQLYRLRSPVSGVVVERNANPGQESRPDATTPLYVVTDPTRLWIVLDVTERDLAAVSTGDLIQIRCNAYPDRAFPGRIDWIGDSLDPATRTVRVRGSVHDESGILKAEMYVTVEHAGASSPSSVVVPSTAVLTDGAKSFCFVQESRGQFRRVSIRVGSEHGGKVPVLSGLPPGARIVTEGSILLASFFSNEVRP